MLNPFALQPSTRTLVRNQVRASFTRMLQRFRSPRRIALSVIGVILGVVWIGQAVAGIMLREPADPEQLKSWLALSLTAYAFWHIIKTSCRKRVEPFEWTPSEKEMLIAAPIERSELVRYRMASIFRAALFKSTIFSLVMIPDLNFLPLGFFGMMVGLLLIDLIRMSMEVFVWGLDARRLHLLRGSVVSLAIGAATFALTWAVANSNVAASLATAASLGFLLKLVAGFVALAEAPIGQFAVLPFATVTEVILANEFNVGLLTKIVLCCGAVWGLFQTLLRLDNSTHAKRKRLDEDNFEQAKRKTRKAERECAKIRSRSKPTNLGGIGPLGWRQLLGAKKYRSQLIFALAIPLGLSCLPALSGQANGLQMVMNVVGGLAFYSFLLLPTTLPFDMRKDFDRIAVLKSLPISPMRIVLGQLSAPFILTTAFQFATLLATMAISPYHPAFLIVAMMILLPFNVFVFGLENLLALWYPYRMNQEGIQVFLRSILAFTAKGILFTIAVASFLTWVFTCKWITSTFTPGIEVAMPILFVVGSCGAMCAIALSVLKLLARSFNKFDPSCDLAGLD